MSYHFTNTETGAYQEADDEAREAYQEYLHAFDESNDTFRYADDFETWLDDAGRAHRSRMEEPDA